MAKNPPPPAGHNQPPDELQERASGTFVDLSEDSSLAARFAHDLRRMKERKWLLQRAAELG